MGAVPVMLQVKRPRCGRCKFFTGVRTQQWDGWGECRRLPPGPRVVRAADATTHQAVWPSVRNTAWCGAFEAGPRLGYQGRPQARGRVLRHVATAAHAAMMRQKRREQHALKTRLVVRHATKPDGGPDPEGGSGEGGGGTDAGGG